MVGHVRRVQQRETFLVLRPGEFAGVDDDTANAGAMAAHVLGQRVHDDVRAMLERSAEHGRGDGVVDDQRHAVAVRGFGQGGKVDDVAGRVADGLAEHRLGALVDQRFQGGDVVVGGEAHLDALARQGMGEQVVSAAVELGHRNDVVADFGDGLNGVGDRCHARGYGQCSHAAFKRCDALFKHVGGGIHDARINVARHLQIEQVGAVLGVIERVRGGLVDRYRHGPGGRVRAIACMNGEGFQFHGALLFLVRHGKGPRA